MPSDMPPRAEDHVSTAVSGEPETRDLHHKSPAPTESIFQGRLHPLTLVFAFLKAGRNFLPLLPLLIFGSKSWFASIAIVFIVISFTQALLRYFTFSYAIEAGDLVIRQGILERTERHIPLERVQEIQIEQGVFHRLFGVVDVVIETAGGQGPEASLSVLSRAEAGRLRKGVFERAALSKLQSSLPYIEPAPTEQREVIRRLEVFDLVRAGLTSNHILSALAIVGAIWTFIDDVLPENIYTRIAETVLGQAQELAHRDVRATIVFALISLIAVFGISVIFSVIGSIALFYNFTFSRAGEDLHRSYGLLTLRSSSLPRRRIQVLEVEEKLLRRLFGMATLRADTVSGQAKEGETNNKGRDVLLPIVSRDEVETLLPVFFPDIADDRAEWNRISRLAIWRSLFKSAVLCAVMIAGLFVYTPGLLAFAPLILLPIAYWISIKNYKSFGYSLGEHYLQTRRGWLGRSTHIVPVRKVQAIEVQRNPVDRWLGLATLMVDTAGQAYTGGGPRLSNLPVEEAQRVARRLAQSAAATQYRI